MAYCPLSRYRPPRRFRSPYGRGGGSAGPKLAVAVAAVTLAAGAHAHAAIGHPASGKAGHAPVSAAAREAIAYAEAQLGKPYLWGGTGPGAFDCSGLAMEAWRSAGVSIARTSQDQWATERRVSSPKRGDLVFFAGSDGTPSSPGHVGIVTDPASRLMIEAYATGYPVRYSHYGPAGAPGDQGPVGFTDPAGGTS